MAPGHCKQFSRKEEAPTYSPRRGELPRPSYRLLYSAGNPTRSGNPRKSLVMR